MTEEESEKFQGIPGVVFVLLDSYIDPQNKEYGGDKYINGTIIPRPPPIQHHTGGRFRDRNRNFDRRRDVNFGAPHSQQGGPMQNQQTRAGNPQQNSSGPMQGDGRSYGAHQNYPARQNYQPQQNYPPQQNYRPQQNFGPPGQGQRGGPMPVNNRDNASGGRDSYQAEGRGLMPSHQGNYNQVGREIIIFRKETMVVMGTAMFQVLPTGDLMGKEQVLVMHRVTMGKERVRDFTSGSGKHTWWASELGIRWTNWDRPSKAYSLWKI